MSLDCGWRKLAADRGFALPVSARRPLEAALGTDFSDVVVHTSPLAHRLNRQFGARAFAWGEHIGFAEGAYDPGSRSGIRLLAHELAHVAQQRLGASNMAPSNPGVPTIRPGHRPDHDLADQDLADQDLADQDLALRRMAAIEWEADCAAAAAVRGERYFCSIADDRGVPACWDVAGHYYMSYLMLLNAGLKNEAAERIARWCWLPDQVEEFEAVFVQQRRTTPFKEWKQDRERFEKFDDRTFSDESQYRDVIQKGFHVLNGRNALTETKRVMDLIKRADKEQYKTMCRGLLLHALGDCFAHRQMTIGASGGWRAPPSGAIENLGKAVLGSASPYVTEGSGTLYDCGMGHARDGHDADHIWDVARGATFLAYVRTLDTVANDVNNRQTNKGIANVNDMAAALSPMLRGLPLYAAEGGKPAKPVLGFVTSDNLTASWSDISPAAVKLSELTVAADEKQCCEHIRRVATDLLHTPMSGNRPEEKSGPESWESYYRYNGGWVCQDAGGKDDADSIFHTIVDLAVTYSGIPLPQKSSRLLRSRYYRND
jgi:hypothetical protein